MSVRTNLLIVGAGPFGLAMAAYENKGWFSGTGRTPAKQYSGAIYHEHARHSGFWAFLCLHGQCGGLNNNCRIIHQEYRQRFCPEGPSIQSTIVGGNVMSYITKNKPQHLPIMGRAAFLLILLLTGGSAVAQDNGAERQAVTLHGELINQGPPPEDDEKSNIRDNVSAVAVNDGLLVVGADEGADVLVFIGDAGGLEYQEVDTCVPLDGRECGSERNGAEVDIEGIAWGKKHLYVVGSHSRARKKAEADKTPKQNRERLETVKIGPSREQLFRFKLDGSGKLDGKVKRISLRNLFANHPILAMFQTIPSKENGLDIEGLAVGKDEDGEEALYLGFRGPVLRGNHAMVMVLEFDDGKFKDKKIKDGPALYFLNLGGRGIRGIAEAGGDGFLILGGPVGDAEADDPATRYAVYLWDGKSSDLATKPRKPLCHVPDPGAAKAEGIEVLNKDRSAVQVYRLLVVYDGVAQGGPRIFECKTP